jgi:hypothetical protein
VMEKMMVMTRMPAARPSGLSARHTACGSSMMLVIVERISQDVCLNCKVRGILSRVPMQWAEVFNRD